MKKKILLLLPILFLGFSSQNLFFLNNKKIEITKNSKIIDFESGGNFSGMTVDTNNDSYADTLYVWGSNNNGQIGNGSSGSDVLSPIVITPSGGNLIEVKVLLICPLELIIVELLLILI